MTRSDLSPAFRAAERARKNFQAATPDQRKALRRRSRQAGIVLPEVRSKKQASDALDRLAGLLSPQQQLEGFGAAETERVGE